VSRSPVVVRQGGAIIPTPECPSAALRAGARSTGRRGGLVRWVRGLVASGLTVVGLVAVAAVGAAPAGAQVTAPPDHLSPGQSLSRGQALYSQAYAGVELILQTDGNLVAYVTSSRRVLWDSNTRSGAVLRFQTDGNVVLYTAANHAVWQTGTYGSRAAAWFGPEPDGDVAARTSSGAAVWHSSTAVIGPSSFLVGFLTSSSGVYRAVMQADGNFVVYSYHGHPHAIWASGTAGHPGSVLVKQSDGNLVIYQARHAVWATQTLVGPSADLRMQDDGNLVLYAKVHSVWTWVWATDTAGGQSAFVGTWGGHGRQLAITTNGAGTVIYRAYRFCSADPTPPCDQMHGNEIISGGHVSLQITAVTSTPAHTVATAHVVSSNDPHYHGDLLFVLAHDVITTPFGSFCGQAAAPGSCGA
jgi:hypothetical protein